MTYSFEKSASAKGAIADAAKVVAQWVKDNPHQIVGGGVGGGLAGLGAYLASRPGKTGRSLDQGESSKLKRPTRDEGFAKGLARIFSNTKKEVADLAAKHPAAMALASVPPGIAAGRAIATKLKTGSAMNKLSSLEVIKLADQWGRERARNEVSTRNELYEATEKLAYSAGDFGHTVGSIGKHIMKTPAAKRALIGAGVGAAKHYLTDEGGGAASLAGDVALGAGAGLGARQGMKMLSGMKGKGMAGKVGRGIRKGLREP